MRAVGGDDAVVEVLYGSGLRVAELCGLTTSDVDLARQRLSVVGKGSKTRLVPLSDPATAALSRWLSDGRSILASSETAENLVFVNLRGNPLTPRDVRRILDHRSVEPVNPTLSVTHSPPTYSTAGPTCAASRSCSATKTCPPLRSTPT